MPALERSATTFRRSEHSQDPATLSFAKSYLLKRHGHQLARIVLCIRTKIPLRVSRHVERSFPSNDDSVLTFEIVASDLGHTPNGIPSASPKFSRNMTD